MPEPNHAFNCNIAPDSERKRSSKGWFRFRVSNVEITHSVRFRINGLSTNSLLFRKGMKPVWMDQESAKDGMWQPVFGCEMLDEVSNRPGTPDDRTFSLVI